MQAVMNKLKGRPRLYLAFYDLGGSPEMEGDRYHTAIVLIPKNPNPQLKESWIYDVKMTITPDGPDWELRCAETRNRNFQLAALVYLSKLPDTLTGERLAEILKTIPITRNSSDWMCQHWVWAALQCLVDENIINPLPSTPEMLWNMGRKFAEDCCSPDLKKPVPTCDTTGRIIKSEVPALESYPVIRRLGGGV